MLVPHAGVIYFVKRKSPRHGEVELDGSEKQMVVKVVKCPEVQKGRKNTKKIERDYRHNGEGESDVCLMTVLVQVLRCRKIGGTSCCSKMR